MNDPSQIARRLKSQQSLSKDLSAELTLIYVIVEIIHDNDSHP
jgi:hypothetical protein